MICERIVQSAHAKGKAIGRPKDSIGKSRLDGKENEIRSLLEKAVGITSIAKIMGVSRTRFAILLEPESLFDMSESEMDFSNIGIHKNVQYVTC